MMARAMTVRLRCVHPDLPVPSELGAVIVTETDGVREVTIVTEAGPSVALVSDLTLGGDFERAVAFATDLAEAIGSEAVYVKRDVRVGRQAVAEPVRESA